MAGLTKIAGIDPPTAALMRRAGIVGVGGLLQAGASAAGRGRIASATGIDEARILAWARHADLFRIKGVGGAYAALLEAAGVRSVSELAGQAAPDLWAAMERANTAGSPLAGLLPSVYTVRRWIAEAGRLPALVDT